MTPQQRKEYRKTWHYKLGLPFGGLPENWISGRPVKVFGKTVLVIWRVANPNYKWNK